MSSFLDRLKVSLGLGEPDDTLEDLVCRRNARVTFAAGLLMIIVQLFMIGDAFSSLASPTVGQIASYAGMLILSPMICLLSARFIRSGFDPRVRGKFLVEQNLYIILCIGYGFYNAFVTKEPLAFVLMLTGCSCLFVMPPIGVINMTSVSYLLFHFFCLGQLTLVRSTVFVYWLSWFVITFIGVLRYQECRIAANTERELLAASCRDELTHIQNRRALRDLFSDFMGSNNLIVLMCDVDNFKTINDGFGHSVGDSVLQSLAQALVHAFGYNSCYRYGGDEFVGIVIGLSEQNFRDRLQTVSAELKQLAVPSEEECLCVSVSCGYVVGAPASSDDLQAMLRIADEKLYEVKIGEKGHSLGAEYSRAAA